MVVFGTDTIVEILAPNDWIRKRERKREIEQ